MAICVSICEHCLFARLCAPILLALLGGELGSLDGHRWSCVNHLSELLLVRRGPHPRVARILLLLVFVVSCHNTSLA